LHLEFVKKFNKFVYIPELLIEAFAETLLHELKKSQVLIYLSEFNKAL
jgi:hypothetical protein